MEIMETTERFPLSADESKGVTSFHMIDVGGKNPTKRRAVARGTIRLTEESYVALRAKKNPKGDVLAVAEVAGIQAVKRVPETIPLCHSLPIDYAHLRFEFSNERFEITVFCEVGTTAKTGVEMEALAGVNGALLSIYDLSKAINPILTLTNIRLDSKEGGKSGIWTHPDFKEGVAPLEQKKNLKSKKASVIVVSDRCFREESQDKSGSHLENILKNQGCQFVKKVIVPDEVDLIRTAVLQQCQDLGVELLLITGGTGVSPRDVTPEALEPLWTKKIPGIGELLRTTGSHYTQHSWTSRSEGGLVGETLVILLPGSSNAVTQGITTLNPLLPHLLSIIKGGSHNEMV
jgi:cyclic pyranopterin phosphate synthase